MPRGRSPDSLTAQKQGAALAQVVPDLRLGGSPGSIPALLRVAVRHHHHDQAASRLHLHTGQLHQTLVASELSPLFAGKCKYTTWGLQACYGGACVHPEQSAHSMPGAPAHGAQSGI